MPRDRPASRVRRSKNSTAERLKRANAQYALAERVAKFGSWRWEIGTPRPEWSPGMFALTGSDPDKHSAHGGWLLNQIHPDDRAVVAAAVATAVETKSHFHYRCRAGQDEHGDRFFDNFGDVELDAAGNVVAVIGVCQEVTEEVRAEEERRRAQEIYRVMAEQASDVISLHAPDGSTIFTSPAVRRVLGIEPAEFTTGQIYRRVHPDDAGEVQKMRILPKPGEVRTVSYRARHADGHYVWIETTTRAVYDTDKKLRHVIAVSRDVSERKQAEFELLAAQRRAEAANHAKSKFLANMSHELRTPLNAIIGFADIMRSRMFGPLGSEHYHEYARLIHESGQLLLNLISDLLDMAKIEAGKFALAPEEIDLAELAEECARLMRDRAVQRNVELKLAAPSPLRITADRRAIKQILLNLVSNAVKFTMPGGHVRVSVVQSTGGATLSVTDDGIGIPANELDRIGRPFEQVASDPKIAAAGTGLGLALVRALAEAHGGSLAIASTEGVGTEVTVTLPREPKQSAEAA